MGASCRTTLDDAKKMPGVLGVFTGEDLDLPPFPHVQPILKTGSERPLIAKGTVRFVGEPVVAVVAVDRHTAVDAGAMVFVDIEPLPAVIDLDDALSDATLVHPDLGTNTYATFTSEHQADFDDCEVVLESARHEPADRRLAHRTAQRPRLIGNRVRMAIVWCTTRHVKAPTPPATSSPSCTTFHPRRFASWYPTSAAGSV